MKKPITLDDVLSHFNTFHDGKNQEDIDGAIAVNTAKREAFNDLFVTIMDPEHGDVREWDESRWRRLIAFAQDFNSFMRSLDSYYKEKWIKARK